MRFKEFLMLESGGGHADSGSDWFYGNSVYPSDAFDWPYDWKHPSNFAFLQARWKKERDQWGRKFYNLDVQDTLDKKFTSIDSNTMPPLHHEKWKHSSKERPNTSIEKDAQMEVIGHGKNAKITNILWNSNDLLDMTDKLNKTFGKFNPSFGNLPDNFDKPWSPYSGEVKMKRKKQKKYPKHLNNFPQ